MNKKAFFFKQIWTEKDWKLNIISWEILSYNILCEYPWREDFPVEEGQGVRASSQRVKAHGRRRKSGLFHMCVYR